MTSTSPAQFAASNAGTVPPLEQARDNVWALGIAVPEGSLPYSLAWLVRASDGGLHVIDPGSDTDENWDVLRGALSAIGPGPQAVQSITATHLHPDHIGMAPRLRAETGAPIQVHSAEQHDLAGTDGVTPGAIDSHLDEWRVPADRLGEFAQVRGTGQHRPAISVDRALSDGDRLEIPGIDLVVMHTPGHTNGSVSLRNNRDGFLVTGDTILPTMFPGLGLGGPPLENPLTSYLAALDALSRYPEYEGMPGHGYRFSGLGERIHESAEHHLKRSREVAAVVQREADASIWAIASQLTWTAGWHGLHGLYLYSALSQTAMHKDYVRSIGL